MTQGITFSGIGSGLDTQSIIDQLVSIERRPISLILNRQAGLRRQRGIIQQINSGLLSLRSSAEKLADDDLFSIVNITSSDSSRVGATATNEAGPGTFTIEVVDLAQARSLSSRSFSSTTEALSLDGEFVVNGEGIQVGPEASLRDLRDAVNEADVGVTAQILTVAAGDNRLILTAEQVGATGFDIKDASDTDILQALGFTSSDTLVKKTFANGGRSAQFLDDAQAIGTLLNLSAPAAGSISIAGTLVDIDLASDSLNDIRDKISAADPSGVTASVVSADVGGLTRFHLEIDGTTDIVDPGGVLETLGVLDSGGALVDEIIAGADSDAFTSTTTAIGSLLGLAAGPSGQVTIEGEAVDLDLTAQSLTDILTAINDAGIAGVTASITTSSDDDGNSQFRLRIDGASDFADANNVLESLGIIVGSNSAFESVARVLTANVTNQEKGAILDKRGNGAASATFNSDIDPLGPIVSSSAAGTITVGDAQVAIDLSVDSLSDIRDKINAAGATGVTASINIVGPSDFELEISGTTDFEDANGVLQAIGILGAPAVMTAATRFGDLAGAGVQTGDTISIFGANHDGDQVAGTFTLNSTNLDVDKLLTHIEQLFGGEVTASVDASGRVVLSDDQAGSSSLSLTLTANNEGGGSLSFGDLAATTQGTDARSAELQAGQDALLRINGIALSRSTNTITDAVEGITLDLREAEEGELIEISVDKDDTTELRRDIESFVAEFNSAMDLINSQFVIDQATGTAGPLSGDSTVLNLQSRLRSEVSGQIDGLEEGFNALVLIGISFTREGRLSIDGDRLSTALSENLNQVRALFVAEGKTLGGGVEFISSTSRTIAGSYNVDITQAATKASLLGSVDLTTGLAEDQTLTIEESADGKTTAIALLAGDTIDDIVDRINSTLASEVAEVRRASSANTTDGTAAVSEDTVFADIFGAGVQDGDTIRIQGTTHEGTAVTRSFLIDNAATKTIGDLLSEVRNVFSGKVSASVDADGRIVITDNQVGPSSLTVTLVEQNEGSGSLEFGSIEVEEEGRFPLEISALNRDGKLFLEHVSFGSRSRFTVTQSIDQLGLGSDEVLGLDVAGTINGEATTGFGRVLTGDSDNETTDGLTLRITTTLDELASSGSDQGTVSLIFGVGRRLKDLLGFITDSIDGTLTNRTGAIDDTLDSLDDQIASMERRVERKRQGLVTKFARLEGALATLQSQGNFLSLQLAALTSRR